MRQSRILSDDGTTGLICDVKDVYSLVKKIEILIEDQELREKYGAAGHKYVFESFDESMFRQYLLNDRKKLLGL